MAAIDPTARIEPGAVIGHNASIGPYCVIGPHVEIGDGCKLLAHVHVAGHTKIGPRTMVYPFASLGTPPQSVKYRGGPTRLVIGADCEIREGVTVNTGTEDARGVTEVGDRCWLMVGSHIAHDCKVGNDVIFANNVVLGGHVTIGDFAVFGGQAAVRQFVRIGEGAMVAGNAAISYDVPPFTVAADRNDICGLNLVGVRRRGFAPDVLPDLKRCFRAVYLAGGGNVREEALRAIACSDLGTTAQGRAFLEFFAGGHRGFGHKRRNRRATDPGNQA